MAPVLETESAFLRELLLNDVEPLAALLDQVASPEAYELPSPSALRPWIASQHERYRAEGIGLLAVIDREAAVLVGLAGLTSRSFDEPGARELFCLIDAAARGRGLGRQVASALRDRAFGDASVSRVALLLPPEHEPSRRLAEGLASSVETRQTRIADCPFVLALANRPTA